MPLLAALILAAPVPKLSAPPPSGFRDGQVLLYSVVFVEKGRTRRMDDFRHSYSRVRSTPDGELYRVAYQSKDSMSHEYTLVTATVTARATSAGKRRPEEHLSGPRGGWWRRAEAGQTQTHRLNTGVDSWERYEGTEVVVVSAGTFTCARLASGFTPPTPGFTEPSVRWVCVADLVTVRLHTPLGAGVVGISELTQFTRGR